MRTCALSDSVGDRWRNCTWGYANELHKPRCQGKGWKARLEENHAHQTGRKPRLFKSRDCILTLIDVHLCKRIGNKSVVTVFTYSYLCYLSTDCHSFCGVGKVFALTFYNEALNERDKTAFVSKRARNTEYYLQFIIVTMSICDPCPSAQKRSQYFAMCCISIW